MILMRPKEGGAASRLIESLIELPRELITRRADGEERKRSSSLRDAAPRRAASATLCDD